MRLVAEMTAKQRRRKAEKRFGELVGLYALGKATPRELALLERYQRLRREWTGGAYTTPWQARKDYEVRLLLKQYRAFIYEFQATGNQAERPQG